MSRGWLRFSLLSVPLVLLYSVAAAAQPLLLVEGDLADLRPTQVTGVDWNSAPQAELPTQFCAVRPGASARLALASRSLTRRQREACAAATGGTLVQALIGRRAVIAMTGGARFSLTSEILYSALAHDVPGTDGRFAPNRSMHWRDLDAALPDAPIRVLLPPDDTIEDRIVAEILLYDGCTARSATALPADPVKRLAVCTTVRSDTAVARASDKLAVAAWLHSQGATAIALVGIAELLAEPQLETGLPLDGVTPSFANIAEGRYRAAMPVYLLSVLSPATVRAVAAVAAPLLAESTIGPLGQLPRRGLAPLAAADRVKLRLTLGREFENAGD